MGNHTSLRINSKFQAFTEAPHSTPQVEKGVRKRCKMRVNPGHRE